MLDHTYVRDIQAGSMSECMLATEWMAAGSIHHSLVGFAFMSP